jgi:hypothetical protein
MDPIPYRTGSRIGDESQKGKEMRQAMERQWTLNRTGSRIGDESPELGGPLF